MSRMNTKAESIRTHNGAVAKHISAEDQLRRSVMSCLLWEREFYESGEAIAERIEDLVPQVHPQIVADMAIEARHSMNLRHVPLFLIICMLHEESHRPYVSKTISKVVSRPDELGELVSMYFNGTKKSLAKQLKTGLAKAFTKFNAYQFAKWNKPAAIKLRDVMRLVHPKPLNKEQEVTFNQLITGTLPVPDTWEVALSSGGDKKEHWTRLLQERKLGALALLRNLRNMDKEGVDKSLIKQAMITCDVSKVLPFRFIAAARYAPSLEPELEQMMFKRLAVNLKMSGKTVLLIDVSGSMDWALNDMNARRQAERTGEQPMKRLDAACGVAMLLREVCEDVEIFTFSHRFVAVPSRRGFALRDAIVNSQSHQGTYLGAAVKAIYGKKGAYFEVPRSGLESFKGQGLNPNRLIVISDEQSSDSVPNPQSLGYMVNVASAKNGVGYHAWKHVDGFSESVVSWIQAFEDSACSRV